MTDVHDVAKYFLALSNDDAGDLISNLKLQKLLYYAQGVHLAVNDAPLFKDDIEAWTQGPVVIAVYRTYNDYGSGAIPPPATDFVADQFSDQEIEIIHEVWSVFGQFSAWKLRSMTHDEAPWKNAYEAGVKVISQDSMRKYFKTRLN
jgi:uncharacterized phage-associated protein